MVAFFLANVAFFEMIRAGSRRPQKIDLVIFPSISPFVTECCIKWLFAMFVVMDGVLVDVEGCPKKDSCPDRHCVTCFVSNP